MNKDRSLTLGRLFGLEIRAKPSTFGAALLIVAGVFLFLLKVLKSYTAVAGGILAMLIHYLSELWHNLGHARAAEQSGFPMQGVTFVGPLASSVYPQNEGLLPAETHIQRALGGPIFSVLLTLLFGFVTLLARAVGGLPLFLATFTFLDNLFVFTIGALLPLGFTDGSTLLEWGGQGRSGSRLSLN